MSETNNRNGLHIDRLENFDDGRIGITLSNSNYFVLEIKYILELPGFEVLAEDLRFFRPIKSGDGKSIYWRDGPRPIGINEFLSLIGKVDCAEETTTHQTDTEQSI